MKPTESQLPEIESTDLEAVHGGEGFLSDVGSAISSGYNATKNFGNGFAGGAIYGAQATSSQIEQFGDRNQTGFKPGVETGMMFNQALGPVGDLISAGAGALPSGGGGGGGQ